MATFQTSLWLKVLLLFSTLDKNIIFTTAIQTPTTTTSQTFSDSSLSTVDLTRVTIFERSTDQTDSSTKDYFGLSLSLIQKEPGGWLFIGAPKSNVSFRTEYNEPGVVWRCPLGQQGGRRGQADSCQLLDFPEPYCLKNKKSKDRGGTCEKSFLGGSMTYNVARDQLIVCASGWNGGSFVNDVFLRIPGRCYVLAGATSTTNQIIFDQSSRSILSPFDDDRFRHRNTYTYRLGVRWFFAQAGVSSHVTQNQEILIGAPGVLTSRGSIVNYRNSKDRSNFLFPLLYGGKQQDLSLLGYAVTSGKYFSSRQTLVAAGSPTGDDLNGTVLLVNFDTFRTADDSTVLPNCFWYSPETSNCFDGYKWWSQWRETGTEFGSYFGSVLESVDINGDGLEELFVGAPFHSGRNKQVRERDSSSTSSCVAEDCGCVFIYTKNPRKNVGFKSEPEQICGKYPWGRFGTSIGKLGDINGDGFEDVGIGAPYENVIYIYFGRTDQDAFRNTPPLTKISAIENVGFRAFGFSISGGVDSDNNGTPDFAVGDYKVGKVALFRTRPKLRIQNSINLILSSGNGGPQKFVPVLPKNCLEFFINVCVEVEIFVGPRLQKKTLAHTKNLRIWASVTMSDDRFSIQRVDNEVLTNSIGIFALDFPPLENKLCRQLQLVRKKGPIDLNDDDGENPVKIRRRFWYNETTVDVGGGLMLTKYKISQNGENSIDGQTFQNFCPTCPAPLTLDPVSVEYVIQSENCTASADACRTQLVIDFTVQSLDSNGAVVDTLKYFNDENKVIDPPKKFIIGSARFIKVTIKIVNGPDHTATLPVLEFRWEGFTDKISEDEVIKKRMLTPILTNHTLSPQSESSNVAVDVSDQFEMSIKISATANKKLRRRQQINHTLLLDMDTVPAVQRINSKLQMTATVSSFNSVAMSQNFSLNYEVDTTVALRGEDKEEIWPLNFAQSIFTFEVTLKGPSRVTGLDLVFLFPLGNFSDPETTSGRHHQLVSIRPQKNCWALSGGFDTVNSSMENKVVADGFEHFGKSQLEKFVQEKRARGKSDEKVLDLNCHGDQKDCLRVECQFEPPKEPSATIRIDFKATIDRNLAGNILDKMGIKSIIFQAHGMVKIFEGQSTEHDVAEAVSTIVIREPPPQELQVWIIIAAGAGGFLLLTCVILGLCKAGFFRRETKNKLEALKTAAAEEDLLNHQATTGVAPAMEN